MELVYAFWNTYGVPGISVAFAAFMLTFGVKLLYKLATNLITDEDYRHLANLGIPFIPVGLGIGLWYAYGWLFGCITAYYEMLVAGILCGVVAILMYLAFGKRVEDAIKKYVKNKKVKEALTTTDAEVEGMEEVVAAAKKNKDPAKGVKKLFAEKAKQVEAAIPDEAKELYDKYIKGK